MGIIAGLMSVLGWGVADFFAAKSSRNIGVFKTLLFSQFLGLLVIGGYFLYAGNLPSFNFREIVIALALSIIYVFSFLLI
jgi:hypothetical protein